MPSDLRPGPDSPPTDELASAEAALSVLQHVLHPIAGDELSKPTPCPEYDVGQLTRHLVDDMALFGDAVGTKPAEGSSDDSVERQIIGAARPVLDAWHRRGLEGTVTLASYELPATAAIGYLTLEFLVHAWDYATATGHPIDVAESLSDYALGLAQQLIPPEARAQLGFGEPVAMSDDAPALDRLIAFTGRDPRR
ncbi:MAG: TIGR03086 family protein [Mycobacterium sp.]|nr:TIGR03086 family protein [Mycobacterium sp.]